ncbi:ComEC/Rec2 family competence protein [Anaerosporobacter sp.]
MIKRPLLWIALSYILGCLLYSLSWIIVGGILFFLVLSLSILYYRYSIEDNPKENKKNRAKQKLFQVIRKKRINKEDRFILLLPIIIIIGYSRMNTMLEPTPFDTYCERTCNANVEGKIVRITEKENSTSYYLNNVILYPSPEIKIPIKQKILVYGDKNSKFKVGNTVRFTGEVSQILKSTNEGQFNSHTYYLSEGIRYQMFAETMKCIDASYSWYHVALASLRAKVSSVYTRILRSEEAGVMQAMFLGETQALDTEIKYLYQRNGISHILSISGLHISFLGLLLYKIFQKIGCPVYLNAGVVSIVVFSYGQMTDFSVSTNRAVVMLLVSMFAVVIGRTYDMLSAISLSSCIILIQNPMQLYNTGFQLSFLAVCVLAVFGNIYERLKEEKIEQKQNEGKYNSQQDGMRIEQIIYEKILTLIKHIRKGVAKKKWITLDEFLLSLDEWIYKKYKLRESNRGKALQSSLIISAATAPILASTFCEIPVYSVILNLFVIPLTSVLMTLGVVAGLIGVWWIDFARVLGYGITFILNFYEVLCNIFAKLPFHLVLTGKPNIAQIVIYCTAVIGVVLLSVKTKHKNVIYIIAFLWILLFRLPSTNLTMTMLDISQGDSIYIKTPKGVSILVDGGSSDVKEIGKYRIEPFLKSQGVRMIDYVVLTHMDADHINAVMEIMERMSDVKEDRQSKTSKLSSMAFYDGQVGIKNLILPETSLIDETYTQIENLARMKGIKLHYFGRGDTISEGELTINCLHPYLEYNTDSKNDTSIVLELTYRQFDALLLGDLESGGEKELINRAKENPKSLLTVQKKGYDIIKIAHHGSKYSTSDEFLEYFSARIAWISSGYGNRYGHPHKELLERLKENHIPYRWTVNEGAITISTDGERMWEISD